MAITRNPLLQYESGQSFNDWEAMTSSDGSLYDATFAPWSGRSGFEASVLPFGLATGGDISAGSANDTVSVAALTAYMAGTAGAASDGLVSVAAGDVTVSRAPTLTHIINSVTVNATGALAVVAGTEGSAFDEARGVAGGPPYIAVDSIEIGQVRLTTAAAAPVSDTEIFAVVGTHRERYDQPVWQADPAEGTVTFASALRAIHTGDTAKKVMVKGYTPIFAELPRVSDFVPADESNSVNSTQIYGGTLGSVSSSLGQASFTHYGNDGITDAIIQAKGENLWFKWFQDKNKLPHSLTQGIVGVARTYPAGDHVNVSVTISAEQATVDFAE